MSVLVFHLTRSGDLIGPALVACFFAVTALAVERLVVLARAAGPDVALRVALERALRRGDLHEALGIAAANSGTFARVALRVMRDGLREPKHMQAAAEEALITELPPLARRVGAFGFFASLATLIGLLGSVTGLFVGYCHVPNADATSKATMLAKGISEAMSSLAIGLFVAVLAFLARWLVQSLIDRRTNIVRAETAALLDSLIASRAHLRILDQRPILEPRGYRRIDARF